MVTDPQEQCEVFGEVSLIFAGLRRGTLAAKCPQSYSISFCLQIQALLSSLCASWASSLSIAPDVQDDPLSYSSPENFQLAR